MDVFTTNQWLLVGLVFLLGLLVGMAFLAGPKWKRRYREEVRRREELERDHRKRVEELEAENEGLRRELREMQSLRHAAAKAPGARADDPAGPI